MDCVVQPMAHEEWVLFYLVYNPWYMSVYTVVQPMTCGCVYHCATHGPWLDIPLYCQGRRGDYRSDVREDSWTMKSRKYGTDQHNTTLGNHQRNLTDGQCSMSISDVRYPPADARGRGTIGGQEELCRRRSSWVVTSENPKISNLGNTKRSSNSLYSTLAL